MKDNKVNKTEITIDEELSTNKNAQWYIVNCNKGHEDKVCADLRKKTIETRSLKDKIMDIIVVKETVQGKDKKTIEKNAFPGYIFIHMIMTDETWYEIRNTPGVTGFIGSSGKGIKPNPLPSKEVNEMLYRNNKNQQPAKVKETVVFTRDFELEDYVDITTGAFKNYSGKVSHLDDKQGFAIIDVELFGRITPVTVDYDSCKKVNT